MKMPCDNAIRCLCDNFPLANFSSEEPDQTIYLFTDYGRYPRPFFPTPDPRPGPYPCIILGQSTTSQQNAEDCTTTTTTQCVAGEPIVEPTPGCVVTPADPNPPVHPPGGGVVPGNPNNPVITPFSGFSCANDDYSFQLLFSGGTAPVTLEVTGGSLPDGLSMDGNGLITGNPTTAGNYTFTVTATDSEGHASSQEMTFTVLGIITDSPLPDATIGTPYSQQLTSGGGGTTFEITGGFLLDGLTMDELGLISGTPTEPNEAESFTVTVTDAFLNTCDKTFSIKVAEHGCITNSGTLPDGTVGSAYSQTLVSAYGTGPRTFSTTDSLPDGLTLNASGLIDGTPSNPGSDGFVVTVTDSLGNHCDDLCTINIANAGNYCSINFAGVPQNIQDLVWTVTPNNTITSSTLSGGDGSATADHRGQPADLTGLDLSATICVSDPAGYDITFDADISGTNSTGLPGGSYVVLTVTIDGVPMGPSFSTGLVTFGPTHYNVSGHLDQGSHVINVGMSATNDAYTGVNAMITANNIQIRPLTHP